jgi:hypothetical protein
LQKNNFNFLFNSSTHSISHLFFQKKYISSYLFSSGRQWAASGHRGHRAESRFRGGASVRREAVAHQVIGVKATVGGGQVAPPYGREQERERERERVEHEKFHVSQKWNRAKNERTQLVSYYVNSSVSGLHR